MKPLSNQVVLKMREDLEDSFGRNIPIRMNKQTHAIEPRPVYGEVLAVGPGDPIQPDVPELRRGDIVVWDLSKVGPPVIEHGQNLTIVSFSALLARLVNPFDKEEWYPLLDMVLTEAAPDAMRAAMTSALVLPDSVLRDGMQERPQGKEVYANQPVTTVFERVLATGSGIVYANSRKHCARCKEELRTIHKPECRRGDLVAFNPAWSIEWRRAGRNLRFTPYSEIRGIVEE
jgi:co-chaperonin GroES (HSP10)